MTDTNQLPEPELGYIKTDKSNQPAFSARQMREAMTERELELIDGMIAVQLDHAQRCDAISNRAMAEKQKGWDMERVELLRRIRSLGITAQATQAEVTDADIEQVLALAHSYADAKLMRYGALGIKEPPDPSAAFIELRRAILSLRPEKVPMTNEELKAARLRVCDDPNELPEPWAFRMGVYAAEAHHGITAQAKKETP